MPASSTATSRSARWRSWNQDFVIASLRQYRLGSPVGLLRLMIQQSNCFIVVERGIGLQNAMQERSLQNSGQLRADSNVGGGQMVTADFIMTPSASAQIRRTRLVSAS
jgi:hypothetical protein